VHLRGCDNILWRACNLCFTKKPGPSLADADWRRSAGKAYATAVPSHERSFEVWPNWMTSYSGGWDIFPSILRSRRQKARLRPATTGDVKTFLSKISHPPPLTLRIREDLDVKPSKGQDNTNPAANQGRHAKFKTKHGCSRMVMVVVRFDRDFPASGRRATPPPKKFEKA